MQNIPAYLYPLLILTRIGAHTNKDTKIGRIRDIREICVSTVNHQSMCVYIKGVTEYEYIIKIEQIIHFKSIQIVTDKIHFR